MDHLVHIAGSIVIYTFLAGVLIVLLELVWYALPRRKNTAGPNAKRIALITGASGGLGRSYALLIDRKSKDIDELWLVGRRESGLRETEALLRRPAKCIRMDLTETEAVAALKNRFSEENAVVRYLVNCAGFGKIGDCSSLSASVQADMISVNCTAAAAAAHTCIPYMDRKSRIVNVCSTAAFQPLHYLNVYAASKAFLLRYSRALRRELLPRQIRVSAVCPYWIKDTAFIETAQKNAGAGVKGFPLSSSVRNVAAFSFWGIRAGMPVITPGIICTLHRVFSKLLPDSVLVCIWDLLRQL